MRRVGWVVLGSLFLCACHAEKPAQFRPDGFHHLALPYRILAKGDGKLLGSDWMLDNFAAGTEMYKQGSFYFTTQLIDTDDDGVHDYKRKTPTFDLRYVHRRDEATIWVRTFPISTNLGDKKLAVLLDRYVSDVTGAGVEVVFLDDGAYVVAQEKRYAARVLDSSSRSMSGKDGLMATVEVADLDQKELTETSQAIHVRLLLVRTGYKYDVANTVRMPVLMLAGYSNREQDFQGLLPEFEDLVSRLRFD